MYCKQIVPIQVLKNQATSFICELPLILGDFSSRQFEIEFYDENRQPLLSRKGTISGLPINTTLVENVDPHTFDYSSPDAEKMFDEQDKFIFEHFKQLFGLTYYDDTFTKNAEYAFSYRTYFSLEGELNVSKPILL